MEPASPQPASSAPPVPGGPVPDGRVPVGRVAVTYCTQCNWLLRAAWIAQELLQTFGTDLAEVALVPGTGGVFRVEVGGVTVWDRRADNGWPDVVELKRRVRDVAVPGRVLGHADRAAARRAPSATGDITGGGGREG